MKKGVLLINPPSPFLIEERVFAPTGVLYTASVIRESGIPVEVLDLSRPAKASDKDRGYNDLVEDYEQQYLNQVRAAAPHFDVIGVSATTPQYKFAKKINDAVKEANPSAKTVIGGAHATMMQGLRNRKIPHMLSEHPEAINNERKLEELLDDFDPNFKSLEVFDHIVAGGASGIFQVLSGNGAPKWIRSEPLGKDITDIPFPARDLIDMSSYNYRLTNPKTGERIPTTNIISQWGCPFPCNFCSGRDDEFYRTVRKPVPVRTIEELDFIHKTYGMKGFMFFDDEMNINTNQFFALLELLKERHESIGYVYRGFIKSEIIVEKHPDTFKRMRDAGFVEVCTGVESGSNRILTEVIKKRTTVDINLKVAELAREAGISFKAFTTIGHPTETEEDAMDTYKWVVNARPTGFDTTVHQPYPGAPVYDFAVKDPKTGIFFLTMKEVELSRERKFTNGSRIDDAVFYFNKIDFGNPDSDTFYKGIPGKYKSNVWTPDLSAERIVELRDFIEYNGKKALGATSVSGLTYDGVMGQSAGGFSLSEEGKKFLLTKNSVLQ